MQLSAQMCLLFLANCNGYCNYNPEDLKNIQKTNLKVIDFVAPKTLSLGIESRLLQCTSAQPQGKTSVRSF